MLSRTFSLNLYKFENFFFFNFAKLLPKVSILQTFETIFFNKLNQNILKKKDRIGFFKYLKMTSIYQPKQVLQELKKPLLTIIHFNDVYDIQAKKERGGICNFKAKLEEIRQTYGQNTITLFSGDAFSPSILSRNKKGWQMVRALNALKITAACYGNHEFDFQEEHTKQLARSCNFPWLLGNITRIDDGKILGDGIPYIIHTTPGNLRIGIFGVAGPDWISIMGEEYQGIFQCEDPEEYSQWMSTKLKNEEKCDLIIALTHMRNGDDLDLAQTPTQIDIILGGHDHVIMNRCIENLPVIKSGSNFHQVGVIEIYQKQSYNVTTHNNGQIQNSKNHYEKKFYSGKNYNFACQVMEIPTAAPDKIDKQLDQFVKQQMQEYKKQDKIMGYSQCPLQARFKVIRTQQSNYGNFFADLFRLYYNSDIAFLNSGCIRNDVILPEGYIKFSKLTNIIEDLVIVKSLPGSVVYKMLEYAVKGLPNSFMGSFLLVSGIKYKYDLNKTPRVQQVEMNGKPIDLQKMYTVAMPSYMGNGADGYQFVKPYIKVVDEVRATTIIQLLFKFFEAVDMKNKHEDENHDLHHHPNKSAPSRFQRIKVLRSKFIETDSGQKLVCINPQIDHRIICLNDQKII